MGRDSSNTPYLLDAPRDRSRDARRRPQSSPRDATRATSACTRGVRARVNTYLSIGAVVVARRGAAWRARSFVARRGLGIERRRAVAAR